MAKETATTGSPSAGLDTNQTQTQPDHGYQLDQYGSNMQTNHEVPAPHEAAQAGALEVAYGAGPGDPYGGEPQTDTFQSLLADGSNQVILDAAAC